jgi:UDP-3-O-[3-hydroxymyristoyl] N-acetylglucosamine deacetylase
MNSINAPVIFEGVGIHTGKSVRMRVVPSKNSGISFVYHGGNVCVRSESIAFSHVRSTMLSNGQVSIQTPEHFLAACYALNITNIQVELSQPELPILDGSAVPFIEKLKPKRCPIYGKRSVLTVDTDTVFRWENSCYLVQPATNLTISVVLFYKNHWIKSMVCVHQHSEESFVSQIAPARTYGFSNELDALKKQGLAKGGSLKNALLVSDTGYVNSPRFDNEMARHKVLDFIGDMAISGKEIRGEFTLIRPSHQGNCEFLKTLLAA